MSDDLFDVSETIVLVTGASGQLGAEYARCFLSRGSRVIGFDLQSSPRSLQLTHDYKDHFHFVLGDVTDKENLLELLNESKARFGVPTVLINNAALDSPPAAPREETGPFEEYPEASWDRVLDVNLKGVFLCCQIFGAAMALEKKGSIINIASIYGLVSPDQSIYDYRKKHGEVFNKPVAYSASKSGIFNLTRYVAVYWAKQNVRVNSLTIAGVFNDQDEDFLDAYCGRIPIGRMASSDEYNGAVLFLASDASRYMTGQNLIIDGGWTAI
jgi:NAD(P)-dependent dehydrogenase (short-subunit alcohol dehydrogenase family)